MESSSSKTSNYIEMLKSKLISFKYPLKQNLTNLNDILSLFDEATGALLNPIKKLKISYNMRINSFKGKYENVLAGVKSKIASFEKNKYSNNFNSSAYLEETVQQSKEFHIEHNKLLMLLEECLHSISTLNKLFCTEQFQQLEDLTQSLRSAKKKSKAPILSLNEHDDSADKNYFDDENNEEYDSHESINPAAARKNGKAKLNGNHKAKMNDNNYNNKSVEEIDIIQLDDSKEDENEITKIASLKSFKTNNKLNKAANTIPNKYSKHKNNQKIKKTIIGESEAENSESAEKFDESKFRKLTDEECLEKLKLLFPEDKGLTKTFITRKLKKRIMINRKLDYNSEETYKDVAHSIPKKSGPNSYLKVTMEICDKDEFDLNSSLMYFIKDLFNAYFIIFKEKEKKMKIVIAGHITKDIISFLKKVSSEEFKNKHSVLTMKIKAYAFYEELVSEFNKRERIVAKKINEAEIRDYVEQFSCLTKMRKAYEEIKLMKVDKE